MSNFAFLAAEFPSVHEAKSDRQTGLSVTLILAESEEP